VTTTDTTCWTPTPRRLAPHDLPSWATPTDIVAAGEDYQGLTEALLDAHTPGGWNQPPAVYGVLTANQLHTIAPTLTPHVPDALMAVRIPGPDVPQSCGRYGAYHLLACLNLTGWHGVVVVSEAWARKGANARTEMRMLQFAAADGTDGGGARRRISRGESPTEHTGTWPGTLRDFLRATVGHRFRPPLPTQLVQHLIVGYLSGDLGFPMTDLMDPALTDDEVVQRLDFTDGVPAPLVDAIFPNLASTVGDIVDSMPRHGYDIAVTPELVDWLGMDFFRLGAAQLTDRDFLVRATWTVLEVANPDCANGTLVRQRLAGVDREGSATTDDSIAARLVADPAFAADAVAHILFAPDGHLWVADGDESGQSPAVRSFVRALRTMFHLCEHISPELPLLAHRIGVLADAAEGTLPTNEALAGKS
jgi:hypothetical protein